MAKRRYKCPYCDYRGDKEELVHHVDEEHEDMIPQGYTAARVVFNHIYNKQNGTCIICGDKTKWLEDKWRYDRLCEKESCKIESRERFKKNMINVHGKTTLLNDMEHQKKMLANRKISGKYKFSDGEYRTYTGTYEKKALEFMDKVLEISSKDIVTPGPIFEYKFDGAIHQFITDIYYIPYNLVFDVKDGGSNKNTHPDMQVNRDKQVAKEDAIKKLGTHNYIRLTDNNFEQILQIFTELKLKMMTEKDFKPVIHINELNMISKNSEDKYIIFISEDGVRWTDRIYTKDLSIGLKESKNFVIFNCSEIPNNIKEMTYEEFLYDARVNIYDSGENLLEYNINKNIQLSVIMEKGLEKVPLTPKERDEIKQRFGKIQCSIGKTKKGEYYAYTHRARSAFYPSIQKLPKDKVKFVSSTS